MMQQVATTKSDIAAIATGTSQEQQLDSGSSKDFERLLQDQQSKDATTPSSKKNSVYKDAQSKSAQISPSNNDSVQDDKQVTKEQRDIDSKPTLVKSENSDKDSDSATEEQANKTKKHVPGDNIQADNQVANDRVALKLDAHISKILSDTKESQKLTFIDGKLTSSSGKELFTELDNLDEWVQLVNNLQKLSGESDSSVETNIIEKEIIKEKSLIVSIKDEEVIATNETVENQELITNDTTDAHSYVQSSDALDKLAQKIIDKITSGDSFDPGKKLVGEDQVSAVIAELKEQPELLRQIFKDFYSPEGQNGEVKLKQENVEGSEQQIPSIDAIESDEKLSDDNIDLLRALLLFKPAAGSVSENQLADEAHPNVQQHHVTNMLSTQLESDESVNFIDLIEEPSAIDSSFIETSNISDEMVAAQPISMDKTTALKQLVNLPESQLDKVLNNIAQQLLGKDTVTEAKTSQVLDTGINRELADFASTVSSPIKEFIGALKSGVSEFKTQLSQGREPGIDLKFLVNEALAKVTEANPSTTPVQNSEQILNNISQLVDFSAGLNRSLDQQSSAHSQTYHSLARDVSQLQGEQTKQAQLSQVESKFEKAVNIAKPEGLQQLADKVRWMANSKNLVAEIRLDPAELGSVHVKVAMSGESATVNFVVQSQQARDAMDNATPRLREMLAEKGIELGQSSVKQESNGQSQKDSELAKSASSIGEHTGDNQESEQGITEQKIVNGALGGIDYFV
ncbi:flagellar hook-length control protein FliK [Paraglaciecola aquimarina]|uniref:Flagellar hook-length control protein FliK n=1 Tax=Paraglaciecola algarum TaxID=3050085 RepID=A0ABS9DDY1_9ALTE|nr:flagellar hook-length control protein FliK [Paraglaciecola sp. G1-23]MCF2950213.1 flagellar hook-length control protein FliK [Paraglaciecola sp. G1-23]